MNKRNRQTTERYSNRQSSSSSSSVLRPRQHRVGYMGDGFYRSIGEIALK